jgi:hypothetical protein
MKRHLISIVTIVVVLIAAWVSFGQPETSERSRGDRARGGADRWRMRREQRAKAIAAMEEQIAKIKLGLERRPQGAKRWQELSDEEKNELRKKFREIRDERNKSIAVIKAQIAKLRGERRLTAEHEKTIGKLKAIRQLAVKEKAKETAAAIDKLIAEQQKEFEVRMEKVFRPKPDAAEESGPEHSGPEHSAGERGADDDSSHKPSGHK